MKYRSQATLLACVSAFAMMVVAPIATASASPTWTIAGVAFKGEETLKIASTGSVALQGWLASGDSNSKITCESLGTLTPPKFNEPAEEKEWYKQHPLPKIFNSSEDKWEMVFSGCKFTEPAECHIASSPFTTNGLGELADEGVSGVADKFGSNTQTFLSYKVTGCSSEGSVTVTGAPRCLFLHPGEESVVKQCEFSSTNGSTLTAGGRAVVLTATVDMELAGANKGKKWTAKY